MNQLTTSDQEFFSLFANKDIEALHKYLNKHDNFISPEHLNLVLNEQTISLDDLDESFDFVVELTKVKNWNSFNKTMLFDGFFIELIYDKERLTSFCQHDREIIEFLVNTDDEEHFFILKSGLISYCVKYLDDLKFLHYDQSNFRQKLLHGETENVFLYGLEHYQEHFDDPFLKKIYFSQLTTYSSDTLTKIIELVPSLKKMDIAYVIKQYLASSKEPKSFDEKTYAHAAYEIVSSEATSYLVNQHKFLVADCYNFIQAFHKTCRASNTEIQQKKFSQFMTDMQKQENWNKFLKGVNYNTMGLNRYIVNELDKAKFHIDLEEQLSYNKLPTTLRKKI